MCCICCSLLNMLLLLLLLLLLYYYYYRVDLYGEGNKYPRRVYLIYDGLHYDPMALAQSEQSPESNDIVIFQPNDVVPLVCGQAYCKMMHDKHAFTDTSKFSLRCGVCGKGLEGNSDFILHCTQFVHTHTHTHTTGEDAAMKHAQATKPPHTNFQEFMK
jgi:hypothetical protein